MFKQMTLSIVVAVLTMTGASGSAHAQVEVNKADQAALESVKGIGPVTSKKILDARKKEGLFKNWPDLAERVKGIGDKTALKFSDAGLTVNGQSLPNAGVVPAFVGKAKEAPARDSKGKVGTGADAAPLFPSTIPSSGKLAPSVPTR